MSEQIQKPLIPDSYTISAEGLENLLKRPRDPRYPQKDIMWTDDFKVELPIKRTLEGIGSLEPSTIIDEFRRTIILYKDRPALSAKRNGHWVNLRLFSKL
jgi:long-chain-fatty-acid--CoA ligase ACSBG